MKCLCGWQLQLIARNQNDRTTKITFNWEKRQLNENEMKRQSRNKMSTRLKYRVGVVLLTHVRVNSTDTDQCHRLIKGLGSHIPCPRAQSQTKPFFLEQRALIGWLYMIVTKSNHPGDRHLQSPDKCVCVCVCLCWDTMNPKAHKDPDQVQVLMRRAGASFIFHHIINTMRKTWWTGCDHPWNLVISPIMQWEVGFTLSNWSAVNDPGIDVCNFIYSHISFIISFIYSGIYFIAALIYVLTCLITQL